MLFDCLLAGEKKLSACWNGDVVLTIFGEAGGAEGSDEEGGGLFCGNKETDSRLIFVIGMELAPVVRGVLLDVLLFCRRSLRIVLCWYVRSFET